jgi:hypothetical protein
METTGLLVEAEIISAPGGLHAVEPLHNEPRDQFIFLTEGKKHWIVYAPKFGLPRPEQIIGKWGNEVERSDITEIVFEGDLEAGDMIYIPRGFVYTTSSVNFEEHSVHLSISILTEERMFTTYDNALICTAGLLQDETIFETAMEYVGKGEEWRRSLPIGFLSRRHLNIGPDDKPLDDKTAELLSIMAEIPPSNYTAAIPFLLEAAQTEFLSLISTIKDERGIEIDEETARKSITILSTLQHPRMSEWEVIYSPEKYNRIPAARRPGRTWFLIRHQTKKLLEGFCNVTIADEKYVDPPEPEEKKVKGRPINYEDMETSGETFSVIDEYDPQKEMEEWKKKQQELEAIQDEPWDEEEKIEL